MKQIFSTSKRNLKRRIERLQLKYLDAVNSNNTKDVLSIGKQIDNLTQEYNIRYAKYNVTSI